MKKVLKATRPGTCALAPGTKPAVLQCSSLTHDSMRCPFQQCLGMYYTNWLLERILCSVHSKSHRTVGAGRDLCGLSGAAHCYEHSCQSVLLQGMADALLCWGHTWVSVTGLWAGTVLTRGICTHPALRPAWHGQRLDQLQHWEGAVGVCTQQHLSS